MKTNNRTTLKQPESEFQRTVLDGEIPLAKVGADAATITRRLINQVDMKEIRKILDQAI